MTLRTIYRHTLIAALAVMVMACTGAAGPSAPASAPTVGASGLAALPEGFPVGSWTSTITEEDLREAIARIARFLERARKRYSA